MATSKAAKKKSKSTPKKLLAAALAAGPSMPNPLTTNPRPGPIGSLALTVRHASLLEFRLWVGGTPAHAFLHLLTPSAAVPLINQPPPLPSPVSRIVSPIPVGSYLLRWTVFTAVTPWVTCVELLIDGVFVFRHYKSDTSATPSPNGAMPVQVIP